MKKKYITTIFVTVVMFMMVNGLSPHPLHAQKAKEKSRKKLIKELDPRFREWLDMTAYIITPLEKDVFYKLTNNRDRDSFINLFWNLRDPSKGTPQNEYKDEHIKRFKHASRYFGFTSPLPGWKTDRGKIYILLGPPVSKNEITANGLYPVEIWDYFGSPSKGLPTAFNIVFYRPYSSGDYRLYIPAVDGPAALLRGEIGSIDTSNFQQVYEKIHEIEPQVALVSLSLIPGESTFGFRPSLQDPLMMSNIYELPRKRINATYARNFLKFKGIVETSVTTDYIGLKSAIYTLKDPLLNMNFIHLALLPERLSVDYSPDQDKYYFNFNLIVILKKGEDVVLQYDKDFPLYYTKEELDEKLSHGLIVTDYFPVTAGKFKLVVILQNSLNKELSYYEKMIDIPSVETAVPRIYGPLVSYRINQTPQAVYSSFNLMNNNIKIDPKQVFGLRDSINTFLCVDKGKYNKPVNVELTVKCDDEGRPYEKTYTMEFPQGKSFWYFTKYLEQLKYGNYILSAKVTDEKGIVLDVKTSTFQVSPHSYVPHPPLAAKTLKPENRFLFYMALASQHQKLKEFSRAEMFFEKALEINKTFAPLIKNYASFLLSREKYDKVLSIVENLKGREKEAFDYHALRGKALYHQNNYNAAVAALLEANKIYDSDIPVINTLALALIKIGQKDEAVKALAASLKIHPNQENVKKILLQLKEEQSRENTKK
jgi:GWxTD domain-containing protein